MKLRSERRIARRKNIYLPTEVWVDVFCFLWITIPRPKLGRIVPKIGNRWFGEQLQFYLHEWGKHTLEKLRFTKQRVINRYSNQFNQLDYPQTAMPENIKFCKSFQIEHFDNRVFNFFRRIQSVLTADTKLDIRFIREKEEVNNMRTILGHLLPLIDGIHTIKMDDQMLPTVVQSFPLEKLHKVKVFDVQLTSFVQSTIQPILEWLTSNNNGHEPKLLQLCCFEQETGQQVLNAVRKQFMEATKPSIFAVIFSYYNAFLDFKCENAIGEQLCGTRTQNPPGRKRFPCMRDGEGDGQFRVFRHQTNAEAGDQLRQWVDGNTQKDKGRVHDGKQYIRVLKPTIGPGRIFEIPDLEEEEANNEKEDEDETPSTSKKRRICK